MYEFSLSSFIQISSSKTLLTKQNAPAHESGDVCVGNTRIVPHACYRKTCVVVHSHAPHDVGIPVLNWSPLSNVASE